MTKELCASITTATSGKLILREYAEGGARETVFSTRKELADYINPQVTAPAAPPYPSNQASAMNVNALHAQPINNASSQNSLLNSLLANKQFCMANAALNANDYLAGAQFNMGNPYNPSQAAMDMMNFIKNQDFFAKVGKQYDCNNCKGIKNADGSCGCKTSAEKWNLHIANMESIKASDRAVMQSKQKSPVSQEVEAMVEYAIKCGYSGNLHQFPEAIGKIKQLAAWYKEQANLQDDGK